MENKTSEQATLVTQNQLDSLKTHLEDLIVRSIDEKTLVKKSTFVSWCEKSDVNALSKIFEYENRFVRITLFFILLVSLCLTAWTMSQSVLAFLEYGVVSQIGIVYQRPTEFPAVTICDNQQGLEELFKQFLNSSDCLSSNFRFYVKDQIDCAFHLAANRASEPIYGDEKRKQLGLGLHQITYCFYNNLNCTNDLEFYWHYDYGSCFQFNVGNDKRMMANIEGIDYGLEMKINFTKLSISRSGTYEGSGMKVFVHNGSVNPRWYAEGVFVRPGQITMIGVKRTFMKNEPLPYTQCTDLASYSSLLYDFIIAKKSNRSTYRQKDCFDLCIQLETIKACRCFTTNFDNPLSNVTKACLSLDEFYCFQEIYFNIDLAKCASNYCPLECDSIAYELSVSSLNGYNSLSVSSADTVHIKVYYSQLEYTFIQEVPAMSLIDLIASL